MLVATITTHRKTEGRSSFTSKKWFKTSIVQADERMKYIMNRPVRLAL